MKKLALRWLRWTAGIVLGMVLLTVLALPLIKGPILDKALHKINTQSDYRVQIDDGALTFLSSFPRLGIQFEGAQISVEEQSPFLEADEIVLYTDLIDLLSGHYELQSFYLRDARLSLETAADGTNNFSVESPGEGGEPLSLSWNNARIKNLEISYSDAAIDQQYQFSLSSARMDGRVGSESLSLDTEMKGEVIQLETGGEWRWSDLPFRMDGVYTWDMAIDQQDFSFPVLELGNTRWNVAGIIRDGSEGLYDFRARGEALSLQQVIPLLPPDWTETLADMRIEGTTDAELHLFGSLDGTDTEPEVEIDFALREGRYSYSDFPGTLSRISGEGSYVYRPNRVARLTCGRISGQWNESSFSGRCTLDHLNTPLISGRFDKLECPRTLMNEHFPDSSWTMEGGQLVLRDLVFRQIDLSEGFDPDWTEMSASISGNKLRGQWKDSSWQVRDLALEWGPDSILLHHASGAFLGDRWQARAGLKMPASLHHFSPQGRAEIYFDALKLDHWLYLLGGDERGAIWKPVAMDEKTEEAWYERIPPAQLDLETEIRSLRYGEIGARDIQYSGRWQDRSMNFESTLRTSSGTMDLEGVFTVQPTPNLHLEGTMESIDIHQLFEEWDDFGQNLVEARHLRGEMDARLLLNANWKKNGGFDSEQMEVISGIQLYDGELIDLKLLEDFSSYIDIHDLRHIRFNTIQNIFVLRNGAVYIPAMFIQSNAANLTVNGVHKLDHTLDYHVKLNAAQVLTRKIIKGKDTEAVPAKRNGWFNMYYTIYGHPDRLSYETDRKKVQSSFQRCDRIRDRARDRLIEHFGNVPLFEEPVDWEAIPEYEGVEGDEPMYLDNF